MADPTPRAVDEARTDKRKVALNSMLASLALTGLKVGVGIASGSIAVLAEAAHSGLDFAAAAMTLWAVRISDKPSDANHPYGHHRMENLSALGETLLLVITCVWILYEAIKRLLGEPVHLSNPIVAVAVLMVSMGVDWSRSRALSRAAKEHHSQALEADALHFSTDILSSATALLGVALVWGAPKLGLAWLSRADAVAAIAIAILTIALSWRLGLRTVQVLTDEVSPELGAQLATAVRAVNEVHEPLRVRARISGDRTFVDVVAHVRSDLTVKESHTVADQIEEAVKVSVRNADVIVHLEPTGKHRSTHE
ncbi:MAG: cation transporter [Deltaproteobacteria bacterium]|nr:cation transporter [Deltaproteobacteria bacterium]